MQSVPRGVDPVEEALSCVVCYALKVPANIKCGHSVCRGCAQKIADEGCKTCPVCREPFGMDAEEIQDNKTMVFFVKSCRKSCKDCEWEGTLYDYIEGHSEECPKRMVKCMVCAVHVVADQMCTHVEENISSHISKLQLSYRENEGLYDKQCTDAFAKTVSDINDMMCVIEEDLTYQTNMCIEGMKTVTGRIKFMLRNYNKRLVETESLPTDPSVPRLHTLVRGDREHVLGSGPAYKREVEYLVEELDVMFHDDAEELRSSLKRSHDKYKRYVGRLLNQLASLTDTYNHKKLVLREQVKFTRQYTANQMTDAGVQGKENCQGDCKEDRTEDRTEDDTGPSVRMALQALGQWGFGEELDVLIPPMNFRPIFDPAAPAYTDYSSVFGPAHGASDPQPGETGPGNAAQQTMQDAQ